MSAIIIIYFAPCYILLMVALLVLIKVVLPVAFFSYDISSLNLFILLCIKLLFDGLSWSLTISIGSSRLSVPC